RLQHRLGGSHESILGVLRPDIRSLGQTVTSGRSPCRPPSHPLARAAADRDVSNVQPAAGLAGAVSGSDRRLTPQPPEAAVPLMLARDPQQCADIVLSFLMRIHGARAGAIFAVEAPPTTERARLFVGNGIAQGAVEWT